MHGKEQRLTSLTDIGANPSAEEADEGLEDTSQMVIDIVHSFRLNETSFDKKSYLSHLKSTLYNVPPLAAPQTQSSPKRVIFYLPGTKTC